MQSPSEISSSNQSVVNSNTRVQASPQTEKAADPKSALGHSLLSAEDLARSDKSARLWQVKTGQAHHTLMGHTHYGRSVVFSPDGQSLLASGSFDKTVRVRQVKTGQARHILTGHTEGISVSFSPDGRCLAAGRREAWGYKSTGTSRTEEKLATKDDDIEEVRGVTESNGALRAQLETTGKPAEAPMALPEASAPRAAKMEEILELREHSNRQEALSGGTSVPTTTQSGLLPVSISTLQKQSFFASGSERMTCPVTSTASATHSAEASVSASNLNSK